MSMTDQATKVAHAGLSAPATAGATSLSVELITGAWPTVPFTAMLEDSTSRKEQVSVTGVSGTTLTVTRAQGGTSAVAHDTSSAVEVITTLADLGFLETVLLAGADIPAHVAAADPHTGYVLDAGLAAHEADTTSIHGITNTAVLATATTVATAVSDHSADTTAVHGITDTAQLPAQNAVNTFVRGQVVDLGTNEIGLIVEGNGTQTNPLIRCRNSGGATLAEIDQFGRVGVGADFDNAAIQFDAINKKIILFSGSPILGGRFDLNLAVAETAQAIRVLNSGGTPVFTVNPKGQATFAEGANMPQGVATMTAGAVTVSNTLVTANSRIQLTVQVLGTVAAPKAIAVTARNAGVDFTITSADGTDTSVVAWQIYEPAPA